MTWQLIIQLLLIAIFVGAIPLTYAASKGNVLKLEQLVWVVLFFTFDLILFGAFTRLTDSGLGCPDWPGCYGHSNPLLAMDHIIDAQQQMPFGPVTVSKAWIEMLHRYFASGVGFLILTTMVVAWVRRKTFGAHVFQICLILFLLVCLQGAFGAWTVTLKLQPIIVSTHLMLALTLVIGLTYLTEKTKLQQELVKPIQYYQWIPVLVGMIVLSQIFLGAWVSTNYAVMACSGFPSCNQEWFPKMDFLNGFTWWRELGKTASGEYLNIEALIAIHWTHRLGAFITFSSVLIFLWFLSRIQSQGSSAWQAKASYWGKYVLIVIIIQVLSGLSNVIFHWPLIAALIHTGGAAALLIGLTKLFTLSQSPTHT
jgi:cytochrome c oxidase assembly protein subunit 15